MDELEWNGERETEGMTKERIDNIHSFTPFHSFFHRILTNFEKGEERSEKIQVIQSLDWINK